MSFCTISITQMSKTPNFRLSARARHFLTFLPGAHLKIKHFLAHAFDAIFGFWRCSAF